MILRWFYRLRRRCRFYAWQQNEEARGSEDDRRARKVRVQG